MLSGAYCVPARKLAIPQMPCTTGLITTPAISSKVEFKRYRFVMWHGDGHWFRARFVVLVGDFDGVVLDRAQYVAIENVKRATAHHGSQSYGNSLCV